MAIFIDLNSKYMHSADVRCQLQPVHSTRKRHSVSAVDQPYGRSYSCSSFEILNILCTWYMLVHPDCICAWMLSVKQSCRVSKITDINVILKQQTRCLYTRSNSMQTLKCNHAVSLFTASGCSSSSSRMAPRYVCVSPWQACSVVAWKWIRSRLPTHCTSCWHCRRRRLAKLLADVYF